MVATIVISMSMLTACEGRKMSNMTPTGDTVELEVARPDSPDSTSVNPNPVSDTLL